MTLLPRTVELTRGDLDVKLLVTSLRLAASRREAQARVVKHGRHHDVQAAAMRDLAFRLLKQMAPTHTPEETDD